jgi:sn1-specific diacylglycerol lipase
VTGHSLGAGTAAILTFLLRRTYPETVCYAFSPPGCVLNEAAAKASKSFVISVVLGRDWVPRLSIESVLRLKSSMKTALVECRLPKYQVRIGKDNFGQYLQSWNNFRVIR